MIQSMEINIMYFIKQHRDFIYSKIAYNILREDILMPKDSIGEIFNIDLSKFVGNQISVTEHFSEEGILPYHVISYYKQLVKAFSEKNPKKILRIATNMGHYIGDMHVPLHTTS
ncbi:MAG: hypothetical protein R2771_13195 [Saprospiraceae bacterium]